MQITKTKYNALGLWSLGPVAMACFVEVMVAISVVCTCLRYADIVERLQAYLQILKKYNITVCNSYQIYRSYDGKIKLLIINFINTQKHI